MGSQAHGFTCTEVVPVVTRYVKGSALTGCPTISFVAISDIHDIPAAGDTHGENDEVEDVEQKSGEDEGEAFGKGKYRFDGKHIYAIWSKSTTYEEEEFYRKLKFWKDAAK